MSAITTITINDGQATPVATNFVPSGMDQTKNLASYVNRSASGIVIGYPRIQVSLAPPTGNSRASGPARIYRAKFAIDLPVLETLGNSDSGVTPPPTVAYTARFSGEFLLPERATLQNRKDILAFAKNLLGHAVTGSLVQDLEAIW